MYPRHTRSLAIPFLLSLLVGCLANHDCTLIGAPPTIGIDVRHVLAKVPDPVWVRACVEATCHTTWAPSGRNLDVVFVDDPSIVEGRRVEVRLTITNEPGIELYGANGTVELRRIQPNGPDCPPTTYSATLVANEDHLFGSTSGLSVS